MAPMSSSPADCFRTYPHAPARKASVASWASACIVRKMTLASLCACFEPAQRLQPAQYRHGNIGDDHVGPKLPGRFDQFAAIAYSTDKVEMIFQHGRQTLGDDGVIVGEQNFGAALHRFPPNGTCTRISVPRLALC